MLRPPRELGSEAFSHAQSGIEPPAIAPKVSLITSSKTEMASLIWLGGPDGRGLQELSPSLGMKRRDFAWLRWSPLAGPSSSTILRALSRSFGVPHRVPSSRYQTLIFKLGTSSLIRSIMGWRVRAKPRGPRGSPCWTPLWLRIVCSPRC